MMLNFARALRTGFLPILVLLFGVFGEVVEAQLPEDTLENEILDEGLEPDRSPASEELSGPPNGQGGWVIVEPSPPIVYTGKSEAKLLNYRDRRSRWGYTGSIGYSLFAPVNYEPTVGAVQQFSDLYDQSADSPLIELQFNIKRNLGLGSIAVEAGAGIYSTKSTDSSIDSELSITMYRLGLCLTLDTLFREPWVAPYVSGGGYIIQKQESLASVTDNESTQVAPYYSFGLLFQLDWIDHNSSINAYSDFGVQNAFLFVEGRQLLESAAEADSNFSTDIFATAGFRVEL